jgi:hypothetical protein
MVLQNTIYSRNENKFNVELVYVPEGESNSNLAVSNRGSD